MTNLVSMHATAHEMDDDAAPQRQIGGARLVEWIVGGVAGLLLLGMVGVILSEAILMDDREPRLYALVERAEFTPSGYQTQFRIYNKGDETAANVEVIGQIRSGDRILETSQALLDYVPARSSAGGSLIFQRNPKGFNLEVAPRGFSEP
ncbi:hypothetical protein [Consotaella aegiceratis]|uniref:hypothetical protein n=1 Tax=Consotaella aegiceratis TaxID=3097961 RepID=UPI002F40BE70